MIYRKYYNSIPLVGMCDHTDLTFFRNEIMSLFGQKRTQKYLYNIMLLK